MKYFLDSAKIDEVREAYDTFGIDGVTTNPNHIKLSGKPFKEVLQQFADFVKEKGIEGYEKFPISVEINPHLDNADDMVAMGKEIAGMCPNFVIKIPCTLAGVTAARRLEQDGIRTNVTLIFSPSQSILPMKNNSLFISPFIGWKENSGEDCVQYIEDICTTDSIQRLSALQLEMVSSSMTVLYLVLISLQLVFRYTRILCITHSQTSV